MECPVEHLVNFRLSVKSVADQGRDRASVNRVAKEFASLLVSRNVNSLHKFHEVGPGYFSLRNQRQQQHESIRPDKSLERQTLNKASAGAELTSIIVAA